MKVSNENIGDMTLQDYITSSQDLIILVTASYNKKEKSGRSRCMLYYRENKKMISIDFTDVQSANQVTLLGLLDAVKHILISGVNVCVISYISPGFSGAEKGKGLYAELVKEIVNTVEKQGNTLSSIVLKDHVKEIKLLLGL